MRTILACVVMVGCLTGPLWADPVKLQWDAPTSGPTPEGYRVKYGTQPGNYIAAQDVGANLTATLNLSPSTHYYIVVVAYIGEGVSPPSNEVTTTTLDTSCTPPLGEHAISIFPTRLQKTGSGGPGSKARLDFQLASPNSPITRVAIQANTIDIASMIGQNLTTLAGMWFTIPSTAGTYPIVIDAVNGYGCAQRQSTEYVVTVP